MSFQRMQSTIVVMSILFISLYTASVDSLRQPSVEELASQYIVNRLFPAHSLLASKLLNILTKSAENEYQQHHNQLSRQQQRRQQQKQYQDEDLVDSTDDDAGGNMNDSNGDDKNDNDIQNVFGLAPVEDILSAASLSPSTDEGVSRSVVGVIRQVERKRQDFGRRLRMRRLYQKRGLGQCIHNCINGRGNMNFIQCKSMCH